jgi:hypothetical protein
MTKTYSALSIYGIIDRMDSTAITAWLGWHKRLKYPPRYINVFTASKFDQGPDVLRTVRDSLPDTTPVWRGYDGKNAWGTAESPEWTDANYYINLWNRNATSPQMAAGMWFARRVKPHVKVIRETNAVVHLLNEAAPIFNAPFETECMRILHEEGIRAGAFAWAAGTPDWPDYHAPPIQEAVAMAAKTNALVMVHEYSGIKPEEQNSLINRNQTLVKLFPKPPDVFLGEFGLAKAKIVHENGVDKIVLDPDAGWGEMDVSEAGYFQFIQHTTNMWYLPNKVSVSLYDWAGWGRNASFGVGNHQGLLDELIDASAWMTIQVDVPPPQSSPVVNPLPDPPPQAGEGMLSVITVTRPAEAKIGLRARIKSIPTEYRNLRASWDYRSEKTGELKPGDVVRRFDIPLHSGPVAENSMGNWIFVEKLDGDTLEAKVIASGYVWSTRIIWGNVHPTAEVPVVVVPPTPAPEPVPEPPAPVMPSVQSKRYSLVIEADEQRHALIEATLMRLLESVVYVGQALGGVKVTLDSTAIPHP